MSLYGAFDKTKHMDELDEPLVTNSGVLAPATRRARVRANLEVSSSAEQVSITSAAIQTALEAGPLNVRFGEQPLQVQTTPATVNATATMTAADLLTGIITSTSAAAVAATLPLATDLNTALLAAYPTLANNDSFDFAMINTGPNTVTVTTNTGWTLVGTMTVVTLVSAEFRLKRTSATAYILYRL